MDPGGLLTILGLAVAAFAIIPKESRLDLSLRISRFDWILISLSILLVHYIIYFPVLNKLGLALNLGPWRWGFSEENTTYLIFLFLAAYLFFRTRTAKVTRKNIRGFSELFECQLLEEKYGELSFLVERHLGDIIKIKKNTGFRNAIAERLRPANSFLIPLNDKGENKDGLLKKWFSNRMNALANFIEYPLEHRELASAIIRRILNSPEYVSYLSISKPYLCLDILSQNFDYKNDFLKLYICGLLDNSGSVYYYELEHTQTLRNNRYLIPESNKLLYYLFKNITVSEELGVYKPVGDKICEIIAYDLKIISRYNEPYGTYDKQMPRCPINSSLHFFEIMIIESMHQGIKWHMWLYYFSSFTRKIIDKLNPDSSVDLDAEFPTPFHFLLYRIVSIILSWLNEVQYIEDKENLYIKTEDINHDDGGIPKSSALALGEIVYMIVSSDKISRKFKVYIIEMVMRFIKKNQNTEEIKPLVRVIMKSVLFKGTYNKPNLIYLREFNSLFDEIDDFIVFELNDFTKLLEESLSKA